MSDDVPQPFRGMIDRICEKDRLYFEQHPEKTERIRNAVQGEMWPLKTPTGGVMLVTQIAPGVRERQLIGRVGPIVRYPGTEGK